MKGQTSWTPIYLLIILAIAVILLGSIIKPMFQQSGTTSAQQMQQVLETARQVIIV